MNLLNLRKYYGLTLRNEHCPEAIVFIYAIISLPNI